MILDDTEIRERINSFKFRMVTQAQFCSDASRNMSWVFYERFVLSPHDETNVPFGVCVGRMWIRRENAFL